MKTITNGFKTELKTMGKEIDAKITYTISGTTYTLGADDLNLVKPYYEGGILKSVMKALEIDSNIDIPLETILECQFGIKVNGSYEYISYGNYIVYSSEKQEDLNSYKIICYDKMLYSMVDYESFATYPITIREYLDALCTHLGLTFKNKNDDFTNYDRTIANELYLDENGNSLGYKFRDVLDELAQVTASTICINENDDEVEIRYITNAGEETTNVSGTNLSIESEDTQVNKIELIGNTTQASTPTPSSPQEVKTVTGLQEIKAVGKNLLPNNATSQIIGNVQFTKNNDGSISANGTSNATADLYLVGDSSNYVDLGLDSGTYTLSGCTSGSGTTYMLYAVQNRNGTLSYYQNQTTGINISIQTGDKFRIFVRVLSGKTVNTIIFPMLEKGSTSSTYEPYQEQVSEINLGKNLIPNNLTSGSSSGITYVVNNDGSIHITGTASARIEPDLFNNSANPIIFQPGTYKNTSNRMIIVYANAGYNVFNANSIVTFSEQKRATRIYFRVENGETNLDEIFYPQIIKNGVNESYSPYFTPIELCKIGTYEDKIFKTSGKNLFSSEMELGIINGSGQNEANNNAIRTKGYIAIKPETTYYLSNSNNYYQNLYYYDSNFNYVRYSETTGSFTTPSGVAYLRTRTSAGSVQNDLNTLYQLELGNQKTDYEPYSNNEWYIKKAIGKKILNGSETWYSNQTSEVNRRFHSTVFSSNKPIESYKAITNYFEVKNNSYKDGANIYANDGNIYLWLDMTIANTTDAFKTWLSTHNTIVYYAVTSPTYEKLNDTLQEELNSIRLLEGLNNIMSSVPIDLTYVSGIDTLDEEYFNEDNVNFGEIYGPVNTIILSRSAESDEIAQSIPSNLSDDEKVAIKISDNQIMNFDNRDEFLYGILTRLYGLRYVQNDYSSKGICYYDLCDRYRADIFGKSYYCVMLNDDVTIESGLSENVFTEIPDTAKTEYSNTTTTDRLERKTTLIVDKQVGEIRAEISTIDDQLNGANGVTSKLTAQGETLELWQKSFDENGNVIALNTTNYTFDSEGLKIGKSTDDYNSIQDNTGTYYYEKDTMIGKYTKEGSVQKDMALFGRYYYGIDEENFNVETFSLKDANFVAQWYDNGTEEGFGHFWNGE